MLKRPTGNVATIETVAFPGSMISASETVPDWFWPPITITLPSVKAVAVWSRRVTFKDRVISFLRAPVIEELDVEAILMPVQRARIARAWGRTSVAFLNLGALEITARRRSLMFFS